MMVSPGLRKARNTASLAWAPEWGCTLAASRAEDFLDAGQRQLLGDVHEFAAAVVALAGIALGVFVGELRALGGHHGRGGVVFAGDQLDVLFLALVFRLDGGPEFGIGLFDEDIAVVHGGQSLRRWSLLYETRAAQANG